MSLAAQVPLMCVYELRMGYRTLTDGASDLDRLSAAQSGGKENGAGGQISQLSTLCAGATYTLSWYSGLSDSTAAPNRANGCTVTAAIDANVLSTKKVCDASAPCTLISSVNGKNLPYRMDTVTYSPTSAGSVSVSFLVNCPAVLNAYTVVDTVSLVRTA